MKKIAPVFIWLLFAIACQARIITVDDNGPADFSNIQAAIDVSNDGDIIEVQPGTYTGAGNRDIEYNGKAITVRSIDPNDPNIVTATIIDCNEKGTGFIFDFDDVNCTLNGLTITNNAGYSAISCYGSGPTIVNCIITNNRSRGIAGHGNPTVSNCIISNNSKGGIEWRDHGKPIITNCIISGNTTQDRYGIYAGGGILFYNAHSARMKIHNCIISGNSAGDYGGGIAFGGGKGGTLDITNCTITGNKAENGGGMEYECFSGYSRATITNCIFSDNTALKGPELYIESQFDCHGEPSMAIAYSNIHGGLTNIYVEPDCELNWDQSNIDADPCFVQTGYWQYVPPPPPPPPLFKASEPNPPDGSVGVNINANLSWTAGHNAVSHDVYFGTTSPPPFVCNQTSTTFDPGTMAYYTTYYWRIDEVNDSSITDGDIWRFTTFVSPPTTSLMFTTATSYTSDLQQYIWIEGDYHLLAGSPCIDAGDPNYVTEPNEVDLDGNPRVINGRIDMGAYEYILPISAWVDIEPNTFNLTSKGKWITAFIWLPEEYDVADIDPNSVLLEGKIKPERLLFVEDEQVAIAKFSREDIQRILDIGEVELTISGRLVDDTLFEAQDTIKVIDKGSGKSVKQHQPAK